MFYKKKKLKIKITKINTTDKKINSKLFILAFFKLRKKIQIVKKQRNKK